MAAGFFLAALVLFASCKKNKTVEESYDYTTMPMQVVSGMEAVQIERDKEKLSMHCNRMERYDYEIDSVRYRYDLYLDGFEAYGYSEDGLLESQVTSEMAKHVTDADGAETWMAFGNVRIMNHINGELMETDTIYWDRQNKKIYTDCYVRMTSPKGLMQGYGMETDEMARNSIIRRPFNSYGVVTQDSTKIYIDTVNFVGPLQVFE
ncbi:MAG: hypothetical protein J6Z27_04670 [Bacteroidales bacterium]|nr:hypothetical protein [Bacteroidales bacterium]